jgi:Domain of unknown function (DUF1707)
VASAYTRATDSDRNDTCEVLDAALDDGQLSMEEHRQRVSAATKATTIGELQSLVADLQIQRAPVQRTKPAGGWGIWIAVVAVLMLLGLGISWGLSRNTPSGSTPSPSSISSPPVAKPTNTSPAAIKPTTQTTTPPPAPLDLLSLGGLSGLLAQVRTTFGDTMGYELVVYPDHASITRPDSVNAHKTVEYVYGNGRWTKDNGASIPEDTTVGDLGKFDVQAVLGALRAAPQNLQMNGGKTDYIAIESLKDGTLRITLNVSDGQNERYMYVNSDGTVRPYD